MTLTPRSDTALSASAPRFDTGTIEPLIDRLVVNTLLDRSALLSRGGGPDPRRNIDRECGYPEGETSASEYRDFFLKEAVNNRVVGVYPDECWSVDPEVYETEEEGTVTPFEAAWADLLDAHNPLHHLHQLDLWSGVGRFGVMLIGFSDAAPMDQPVDGLDAKTGEPTVQGSGEIKLLYMREFDETQVRVEAFDPDPKSPRYGWPTLYSLTVADFSSGDTAVSTTVRVHWTRCLHFSGLAQPYNRPRQESVFRRLLDIRKVASGSGEMYWKAGSPGLSFEALPQALESDVQLDKKGLKDQVWKYENGLQKYFALMGMTAKTLPPQVTDPTPYVVQHLQLIATSLGVPYRVFVGSEAAHLASTQDITTWNKRVARRQRLVIDPLLIRPFVNRLVSVGALPRPARYSVSWRDMNALSDKDKADVALKRAQALLAFVTGDIEAVMPLDVFLTTVLGLTSREAAAAVKAASADRERLTPDQGQLKEEELQLKARQAAKKPTNAGTSASA